MTGCPFYKYVPKELHANIQFRKNLIEATHGNRNMQELVWTACAQDILFYVNAFVWTVDSRLVDEGESPRGPFISYEFQDPILLSLRDHIRKGRDIAVDKCREMGVSWMALIVMDWEWRFHDGRSFMLVSRKEDLVDDTQNDDCLFAKLDFIDKYLPNWLVPTQSRTHLNKTNLETGSRFKGESTTGSIGVGGRNTAILLDEFAKFDPPSTGFEAWKVTRDNTRCRIVVSTHQGTGTCYYQVVKKEGIDTIEVDWWEHPKKWPGSYVADKDSVTVLDEGYEYPPDFEFIRDGKRRSPWYDYECSRCVHPTEVASELDRNPQGSNFPFYDAQMIEELVKETARLPTVEGELLYDKDTGKPGRFEPMCGGPLKLWIPPQAGQMPFKESVYSIGADLSEGSGASLSVLSVINRGTGEKAAEFARSDMTPDEFAAVACALGRWFAGADLCREAYLVPEVTGPGVPFLKICRKLGYVHFYFRKDERKLDARADPSMPGWYPQGDSKKIAHSDYRMALKDRRFVNRSEVALRDCLDFFYCTDQRIRHAREISGVDPSGLGESHGDYVTADMLAWKGRQDRPVPERESAPPQPGTYARRRVSRRASLALADKY